MRITCPNCGAQYEVDDALIPESGRDVQCSNCGKGWFQSKLHEEAEAEAEDVREAAHAAGDPEPEALEAQADPARRSDEAEDEIAADLSDEEAFRWPEAPETEDHRAPDPREEAHAAPPQVEAEEDDLAARAPDQGAGSWADEDEPTPGPAVPLPPRKTDENVLAVLREEAERELAERRREAQALETQGDLGLAEPVERSAARESVAAAAVAAGARRDLLPDIDAINSTLRSDADRPATTDTDDAGEMATERRRGFRLGFGLMILLAAVLIALYLGAGWLAAAVPALEPVLAAYVGWANGVGAWFDGLLAAGVDGISALTAPGPDAS